MTCAFLRHFGQPPVKAVILLCKSGARESDNHNILFVLIELLQLIAVLFPQAFTLPFGKGSGGAGWILKTDRRSDFASCKHFISLVF